MLPGFELARHETLDAYECMIYRYQGQLIHYAKVTAPINAEKRVPLYDLIMDTAQNNAIFCIVDNLEGHQNDINYDDMQSFDQMMVVRGFKYFYGTTLTIDDSFDSLIKLANIASKEAGLIADLRSSDNVQVAIDFLKEAIENFNTMPLS